MSLQVRRKNAVSGGALDSLTLVQQRALGLVREVPGISVQAFAKRLSVAHSTAIYQLNNLAKLGLIQQLRVGREVLSYPLPHGSASEPFLDTLMRDPRKRAIIKQFTVAGEGRVTINQVAKRAGLGFNFTKRLLQELEEMHLLTMERVRYQYRLRVSRELAEFLAVSDA